MAPGFGIQQSPCVNIFINYIELNEIAGAQSLGNRSNAGSKKASIPFKASISPLVPLLTKELFLKFIKMFMKPIQA